MIKLNSILTLTLAIAATSLTTASSADTLDWSKDQSTDLHNYYVDHDARGVRIMYDLHKTRQHERNLRRSKRNNNKLNKKLIDSAKKQGYSKETIALLKRL